MNICPNCKSKAVEFVFHKANVITFQNVLIESQVAAYSIPRGEIELYFCSACAFLFNAKFDESLVGYGEAYENDQSHSAVFQSHIEEVLNKVISRQQDVNTILEIGCGNGYFIRQLVSSRANYSAVGYDASLKKNSIENNISLYKKYYEENDEGDFDLIISRHVIEHVLDNNFLISLLKRKNPKATFMIETPSLEWIIENNTFFDIFYEHCSYFSQHSLRVLLENHGLKTYCLESIFSGQYLWGEASGKSDRSVDSKVGLTLDQVKKFFLSRQQMIQHFRFLIEEKSAEGKMAIWGAGAKGVTFANLIDPQHQFIDCLIDINPNKCGKYLPGSGHPILSPQVIRDNNYKTILIMNPNYHNEICTMFPDKDINFCLI